MPPSITLPALPALPAALQARVDALTPSDKRALAIGASVAAASAAAVALYRLATRPPRCGPHTRDTLPTDTSTFDVAIVGAGPAGAVAAWYASRGGVARVALLDRAKFPR